MPTEKSAGAVIFRKKERGIQYLLLHYQSGLRRKNPFWDFSKGHIEKGENEIIAAKREAKEETGLDDISILEGFKEEIKYFFKFKGQTIFKTVVFFLAETKTKKITLSFEHKGFKWLPFKEALELLTFQNGKDILQKANNYLNKQYATFSRNK
ncbi:MAG: bis(5'-nucleosyl)-tetraphosphatase [bacterium]